MRCVCLGMNVIGEHIWSNGPKMKLKFWYLDSRLLLVVIYYTTLVELSLYCYFLNKSNSFTLLWCWTNYYWRWNWSISCCEYSLIIFTNYHTDSFISATKSRLIFFNWWKSELTLRFVVISLIINLYLKQVNRNCKWNDIGSDSMPISQNRKRNHLLPDQIPTSEHFLTLSYSTRSCSHAAVLFCMCCLLY